MTPNKNSRPVKRKSNRKTLLIAVSILAIIVVAISAYAMLGNSNNQNINPTATPTPTPTPTAQPGTSPTPDPLYVDATKVLLHTSMGDITVALRNDKPITTGNFLNLVNQGTYNSTIFHRIIAGFMIQGGAPTNGQSVSDIQDEIGTNNHNYNGTIAMANTGAPNSASSQFFINVADNNIITYQNGVKFDDSYTVFGKVVSGMDVVMAISNVATDSSDRPFQNVTLLGATVIP